MRYSLTSALLVFFMFERIYSAHGLKNVGNVNFSIIDTITEVTP